MRRSAAAGSPKQAPGGSQRLVESAWTYRYPPKVGAKKLYRLEQTPADMREIAWKAQSRLTARYRAFTARGKKSTVVRAAIAREMVGFIRAVGRAAPAYLTATTTPRTGGGGTFGGEHLTDVLWPATADARLRSGSARTHDRTCGSQSALQSMIADGLQVPFPPVRGHVQHRLL